MPGTNQPQRIAIDIGSTVVKVARLGADDTFLGQDFHSRDFEAGISSQVGAIVSDLRDTAPECEFLLCSSANGGLRVGIVCLTETFSGAELRNQVLSAGANPLFVHTHGDAAGHTARVDILLVAGGIDCPDAGPLEQRLSDFDASGYRYGSLVYAGNSHLAADFQRRYPGSTIVANPLAGGLKGRTRGVFEAVRRAYLDDLVYKEGVSELQHALSVQIRPTPEIVNRGFGQAVFNRSSLVAVGPCVLIDIGGATTDIHYTVEIVSDASQQRPAPGSSVARYVFTDLGLVASRDSTTMQLRSHSRTHDILNRTMEGDVTDTYRSLREGDGDLPDQTLAYACLFLALDRFAHGDGLGLPQADIAKVSQIILTGGGAQSLDETVASQVAELVEGRGRAPTVVIDKHYRLWLDGFSAEAMSSAPATSASDGCEGVAKA